MQDIKIFLKFVNFYQYFILNFGWIITQFIFEIKIIKVIINKKINNKYYKDCINDIYKKYLNK